MYALTLDNSLPWATSHEEDRRFLRVLFTTLLACLVFAVTASYVKIPKLEKESITEDPPRRVRLLPEPARPTPAPPVRPTPASISPSQDLEAVPGPEQAATAPAPGKKITGVGVLAIKDKLAALTRRDTSASIVAATPDNHREFPAGRSTTSGLTENLTLGSGGIEDGVTNHSVLGTAALPDKSVSVRVDLSSTGTGSEAAQPASSDRQTRSQENIQEQLDLNKGAMYTLYNRELRTDPDLHGKLVMAITIAPRGHVVQCAILSSELNSESLERELVALVKSIDFGDQPGGASISTRVPIEFFPR